MEAANLDSDHERPLHIILATIVVFLTGFLVFRSWGALRHPRDQRKLRLPPGPRGLPWLGSLLSLGEFPHKSFLKLSKKYGPLLYMRLGSRPVLVVCNSEMMKEVLQANDQSFASRPSLLLPSVCTYNFLGIAFTPYGAHWRLSRKICTFQLFNSSRLNHFSGVIDKEITATIQLILEECESGNAVNVTNILNGLATNIMTQMMWKKRYRNIRGTNFGEPDKFQRIAMTMMEMIGANNVADFLPATAFLAMKISGKERKTWTVHNELDEFLEEIICAREKQLSKSAKTATATEEDDFLGILLKQADESCEASERLSRNSVKAILTDMIVAGTDTSSVTVDWAMAELLRHPDVMNKAQDELSTIVGNDRLVTHADIPKLSYLDAIVKEVLRRRIPGPLLIPHLSLVDCKVGGYDVPANTMVLPNAYAIHHDPDLWDKPMEFNPDRFLGSDLDFKGRGCQYLPFSTGRRMCPGVNLASSTLHLGLAQLLHTIRWSLPTGQAPENIDMTEKFSLVIAREKPLHLIATPRLPHNVIF